eukprot:6863890-Prymnesium_polylepis.1
MRFCHHVDTRSCDVHIGARGATACNPSPCVHVDAPSLAHFDTAAEHALLRPSSIATSLVGSSSSDSGPTTAVATTLEVSYFTCSSTSRQRAWPTRAPAPARCRPVRRHPGQQRGADFKAVERQPPSGR